MNSKELQNIKQSDKRDKTGCNGYVVMLLIMLVVGTVTAWGDGSGLVGGLGDTLKALGLIGLIVLVVAGFISFQK